MEMNYPGDLPSFQKVSQQGPLPEKSLKEHKELPRINKSEKLQGRKSKDSFHGGSICLWAHTIQYTRNKLENRILARSSLAVLN